MPDGYNRAHPQEVGEVPQGWMLSQIPGEACGLDQLVCDGNHRVVAQVTVYARALGVALAQKTCDTHEPSERAASLRRGDAGAG